MRLLIVEDHREVAAALNVAFADRGIRCDTAHSSGDADHLIGQFSYTVIILDLGLPDEDGLALLRRLRRQKIGVPVIVLTARSEGEMRVIGLDAGADDYIVKPFLFAELHARLQAVLRRQNGYVEPQIIVANLSLDIRSREVRAGGSHLELSVREVELLELLMRRAGHVVPKRIIEDQLFGAGDGFGSNAIEVYIHRLRKRLEHRAAVTVQTVRGIGYMLLPA